VAEPDDGFADEVAATNKRRLQVLLPLMAVVHLVHVVAFHPSATERAHLDPTLLMWRDGIWLVHASTMVAAVGLWSWLRAGGDRAAHRVPIVVAATWLLHAAAIAAVDQLNAPTVSPFIGYSLGIAVILCLSPREAAAVYGLGVVAYLAAIFTMQPSPDVRMALLPNGPSVSAVSMVLVVLLDGARRRDFTQRKTILAQAEALAKLNAGLEQRVQEQISEITARASEVDRLNAQLQAQVRTRSIELSNALARLAERRGGDAPLPRGMLLGGRFEIQHLLGIGGMGAVYSGTDKDTGHPVAIKVIQATSASQLDALHRFLREAGTAAAITHPGVVRMLHVDVSADGMFFQVQELVEGETLQHLLARIGRCEPALAARIGAGLCEALAAAHARGVVHRDVKPGNVMLTRTPPGLKLLDFGVSKLNEEEADTSVGTRAGVILGTPAFMGPDQLAGAGNVTDRADMYAVGVTLWLMLAGRYPFSNTTLRGMVLNHLGPPPDLRNVEPATAPELAAAVSQCMAKDPEDRPTAAELGQRLAAFADAHDPRPLEVMLEQVAPGDAAPTLAPM
jgi:hypothetical protein